MHECAADKRDWLSSVLPCDSAIERSYLSCLFHFYSVRGWKEVITFKIWIRLHAQASTGCECPSVPVSSLDPAFTGYLSSLNHCVQSLYPSAEPRDRFKAKLSALLIAFLQKYLTIWNIDWTLGQWVYRCQIRASGPSIKWVSTTLRPPLRSLLCYFLYMSWKTK